MVDGSGRPDLMPLADLTPYNDAAERYDVGHFKSYPVILLHLRNGEWVISHYCDRTLTRQAGIIVCAPRLSEQHQVVVNEGVVTVTPSILCPDCQMHGYVTNGEWVM